MLFVVITGITPGNNTWVKLSLAAYFTNMQLRGQIAPGHFYSPAISFKIRSSFG